MKATAIRTQRSGAQVVEQTPVAPPIPPLGTLNELDAMILQQVRQASLLAIAAGGIKATWLDFTDTASAKHAPVARKMVSQIHYLRSLLADSNAQMEQVLRDLWATANIFHIAQGTVHATNVGLNKHIAPEQGSHTTAGEGGDLDDSSRTINTRRLGLPMVQLDS